jgi:hypothetical protein
MGPSGEQTRRVAAFGYQLVGIHDQLRADLARLRADSRSGRRLQTHCLAFCSALTRHHSGEDGGAFQVLVSLFGLPTPD